MIARAALAVLLLPLAARAEGPAPAQVSACFSPGPVHCAEVIVDAIDAAQATIRVQANGFIFKPELHALAAAKARGVDVQVIVKGLPGSLRAGGLGAVPLTQAGIPVWVDPDPTSTHGKVLILDASTVITSAVKVRSATEKGPSETTKFYTEQNVTVLQSPEVAGWYGRAWEARRAVSRTFGAD